MDEPFTPHLFGADTGAASNFFLKLCFCYCPQNVHYFQPTVPFSVFDVMNHLNSSNHDEIMMPGL